jgi:ankyrin repeat protein
MDKLKSRFNAGLPIPDHGDGELHNAVRLNQNNKVTQLLSHSYDADQFDKRTGYTALMVAAKNSNNEGVRLLLQSGAEVRYQNRRGATALHFACKAGEGKIARLILDRAYVCRCVKVLVDIRNTDGRTARELAQGSGESQLVAKLDAAVKQEAAVRAVFFFYILSLLLYNCAVITKIFFLIFFSSHTKTLFFVFVLFLVPFFIPGEAGRGYFGSH